MSQDQRGMIDLGPYSTDRVLQALLSDPESRLLGSVLRKSPTRGQVVMEVHWDLTHQDPGIVDVMVDIDAFVGRQVQIRLDRSTNPPRWESQDDPAPEFDPESD